MTSKKTAPPIAFLVLLLPFGISSGYVTVTLTYQLGHAGMAVAAITAITAFSVWPQTWKMFWAPLVDTTLRPKVWHVVGGALTGLAILALSLVPAHAANTALLITLVIVSSLASTLVSMSSEILMAYQVDEDRKGEVSGWSQAGNLGGAAAGGGLGLFLAQHTSQSWAPGVALAVVCMLSSLALLFVSEPQRAERARHYLESLKDVGRDVWAISRTSLGFQVLVLMLLPIGSGGAQSVFPAIAGEWHAGVGTVELVNGGLSAVACVIGAVAGGFLCDRMDRRLAYCLFGLALGVVAVVMAVAARSPMVFVVGNLAYSVVLSACYAGYSAAVLEAIGQGAAATKFNLMSAVSNIPIAIMGPVDGQLHDRFGTNGMLFGEAAVGVAAMLAFGLLVWGMGALIRRRAVPA